MQEDIEEMQIDRVEDVCGGEAVGGVSEKEHHD